VKPPFRIDGSKLKPAHNNLLSRFLDHVTKSYDLSEAREDFLMQEISIGISRTDKLFVQSKNSYPFFLKVGDAKNIKREDSKYGQAARKIPALSIPPKEIFIEDKENDCALIAFRYVTGSNRGDNPTSLFYHYVSMDTYSLLSLIDDLFTFVLSDFHSFRNAKYESHEIPALDVEIFRENADSRIDDMVEKYNKIVAKIPEIRVPLGSIHGDLHTENILVGRYNNPILIDFEMAVQDNCLLRDYAEFEVALLLAAATTSYDEADEQANKIYNNRFVFGINGISKLASSTARIRANLFDQLSGFSVAKEVSIEAIFHDASLCYRVYILRYLCFYVRIANMNQKGGLRHGIIALFHAMFEKVRISIPAEFGV